jgi:hypothetical protein
MTRQTRNAVHSCAKRELTKPRGPTLGAREEAAPISPPVVLMVMTCSRSSEEVRTLTGPSSTNDAPLALTSPGAGAPGFAIYDDGLRSWEKDARFERKLAVSDDTPFQNQA